MSRPYAEVIGDPIAQSKSPAIHNYWLRKAGIDAEYRACHVQAEELDGYFARRRRDAHWRGCNVTIPHKVPALELADHATATANAVGAANCMIAAEHEIVAENTDVSGILAALPEPLLNGASEVCVLGSGGAARAALEACRQRNVGIVLLSVRNQDAGRILMNEFGFGGSVGSLDDAHNIQTADVVINATPLGMLGSERMPATVLTHLNYPLPDAVAFDMVYNPLRTEFLEAAAAGGFRTVDGLSMLIGQAAAAFEKFFGVPAPREHDAELRALLTP